MTRKSYILKDGNYDGLFNGIGVVKAGEPVTPLTDEQETLLRESPYFKQYTGKVKTEDQTAAAASANETTTTGKKE